MLRHIFFIEISADSVIIITFYNSDQILLVKDRSLKLPRHRHKGSVDLRYMCSIDTPTGAADLKPGIIFRYAVSKCHKLIVT